MQEYLEDALLCNAIFTHFCGPFGDQVFKLHEIE